MLASVHFGIRRTTLDDWFDPILDADTELFVDPFLVFKEPPGFWSGAHASLINHFNRAFMMIAEGSLNPATLAYKKALALLVSKNQKNCAWDTHQKARQTRQRLGLCRGNCSGHRRSYQTRFCSTFGISRS